MFINQPDNNSPVSTMMSGTQLPPGYQGQPSTQQSPSFMDKIANIDPQRLAMALKYSGAGGQPGLMGGMANGLMLGSLINNMNPKQGTLPTSSLGSPALMAGTQLPPTGSF